MAGKRTVREGLEELELETLSSFATLAINSMGRKEPEEPDPTRTCFMRDRDRVIHSKAFRRLKHKTQVYISPNNDHYRTRLTHALEVSQIGRTIGRGLRLNCDLIEAIALAHDVGQPPFAHTGEEVLDNLLEDGFKHNENSVRVLNKIERREDKAGLNLTWEVLDGVLHHSGFARNEEDGAHTLEGQVIRMSDKIAYVQHDIDDSIRAGILTLDDLPGDVLDILGRTHRERIATLVNDVIEHTSSLMRAGDKAHVGLSPVIREAMDELRDFMFANVYKGEECVQERSKVRYIIEFLFHYYQEYPENLPAFYQELAEEDGLEQAITDYIAGMTDTYCVNLFKKITHPRSFIELLD
ncbi:MAG: deoxyguanosinetriphosphate triphosphohydrolase [Halanaerobium sp.]|nr:deoxyguanosinetriphosphate triphosphohydrolase [Halanaerobium sp.]